MGKNNDTGMSLKALADKLIPAYENKKVLTKAQGITRDIIKEVLDCYEDNKEQLKQFAPYLKGKTVTETCENIWNFWKKNIRYQVDDVGVQWIKTPAAVWATKFCDCKSFSVAIASCLYCLGIKGKFRFTSYGTNDEVPTHVYVVALDGNKEILIDCVWKAFNSEKPYTKKWDYNMTNIYRISGTQDSNTPMLRLPRPKRYAIGELNVDLNDPGLTEAELDLGLTIQGLELEQRIMRRHGVFGIGDPEDDRYQTLIEGHKIVLRSVNNQRRGIPPLTLAERQARFMQLQNDPAVGNIFKKIGKGISKAVKAVGKGIKKVAKGVAKGVKNLGKAITKVVKTPARMAAQGALKDSGPFFLYLFLDPAKIPANRLPEIVQVKRNKAIEYENRIVKKLQMPMKNFKQLIRNSIMQAFGNTPENVLADWMSKSTYRKIGDPFGNTLSQGLNALRSTNMGVGNPMAMVQVGMEVIKTIGPIIKSLFGKLGEDLEADMESFTPSPEDWGIMSIIETQGANNFQIQNGNGSYYGNSGGNLYQEPNYDYSERTNINNDPEPTANNDMEVWTENVDADGNTISYTNLETGETLPQPPYRGKNGERVVVEPAPVAVKSTRQKQAGGSGMVLLGIAAAALALSSNKK